MANQVIIKTNPQKSYIALFITKEVRMLGDTDLLVQMMDNSSEDNS
jgi:hypothetical protein